MHVSRLTLTNVRQFEYRTIAFQPGFNLLVGENGAGKTTILRGLLAALGSAQQTGRRPRLADEDIRLHTRRAEVMAEVTTTGNGSQEYRFRKDLWEPAKRVGQRGAAAPLVLVYASNESVCGALKGRPLRRFRDVEEDESRRGEEFLYEREMESLRRGPVAEGHRFGNSHSVREFAGKVLSTFSPAFRHFYWRFEPYDCSLRPPEGQLHTSFAKLRDQVRSFVMRYLQEGWRREGWKYPYMWPDQAAIIVDKESFERRRDEGPFPDVRRIWRDMKVSPDEQNFLDSCALEIRLTPRIMIRRRDGSLHLSQLSDGEQRLFSLFVDIARQLSLRNENDEIGKGEAVVLIDEIDVHLHPKWQRKIVPALEDLFKGCQFIATTHSPFVIQAVDSGKVQHLNHPLLGDFQDRGIEEITARVMGIENHEVSERYLAMLDTAKEYFQLLEGADATNPAQRAQLKQKLNELSSRYADNPAYQAYLEMHGSLTLGADELR
jgi:predicted ATPase